MKAGQYLFVALFLSSLIGFIGCEFSKKVYNKTSDAIDNVNIFSYQDDIALGKQVSDEIANNPSDFPVLSKSKNKEVYNYIEKLKNIILNSGELKYKSEFVWEVTIIDDDETLNAFATPGGYIYIYTGLIKFLDGEDELLGVLGHEMAHSDQRHSTRQLTKTYGIAFLLDAVLGDRDALEQVVIGLTQLSFSRSHETEADEFSVKYLCNTNYNAAGSADFFRKMEGQPTPPEFLSTHPNPEDRVENIEAMKNEFSCSGRQTKETEYNRIKAKL